MRDILIKDLKLCYDGETVFSGYSCEIPAGSIGAVTGPSGKGKTTLLCAVMGLKEIEGGYISGLPDRISAVFQDDRLFEDFSMLENLKAAVNAGGKKLTETDFIEHLKMLGLEKHAKKKARDLSGGMRRRLAIIRAVMTDSELIVMDEPFKGIDDDNKKIVMDYIKEHRKGRSLIFTTHDTEDVKAMGAVLMKPIL